MDDDNSDASSSGSSPSPVVPGGGASAGTEDESLARLMDRMMGRLDRRDVLESLLAEHRWSDVAVYLQNALDYHREAAQAAIAYPDDVPAPAHNDMPHAHPELFVLPRRQQCLELLGEGKREQAQQYFNDMIFTPTRDAGRTRYLDDLLEQLPGMIAGNNAQLNLLEERHDTCRSIQDYLRVYFPAFGRGDGVRASKEMWIGSLHWTTAKFGELIGGDKFRCLVCHKQLTLRNDQNNRMVSHLHDECPNITPAIRSHLPKRNRPPQFNP